MDDFCLPLDYIAQSKAHRSDDFSSFDDQPEVYYAADYFCRAARRPTVIDIGCRNGQRLLNVKAERRIGIGFGQNIEFCRNKHPSGAIWIESDLSKYDCIDLANHADDQAVVICADVIQHLSDPSHLLAFLAKCYLRGAIVITSTLDRVRCHGQGHRGPPTNTSHVREWSLDEYETLLRKYAFPPVFSGYTFNNNRSRELTTIVTLHDRTVVDCGVPHKRPLAILSAFNEADVIGEVIGDLVQQGCDVAAIDNWSTDSTWQIMKDCREQYPENVVLEKFPLDGSTSYYEWEKILKRKEEIAAAHCGRWILHTDADEVRRSPFSGMTLAQALKLAEESGANRVAFNLVDFRPTTNAPYRSGTLTEAFSHFEFGSKLGHFWQVKAWLQGSNRINLAASGGHAADFEGAIDYPYRFLLRHYSIRSSVQGRKKVLDERQKRWLPEERKKGWHRHYDSFGSDSIFVWDPDQLMKFDKDFWRNYGIPIMTDIAQRRQIRSDP